jgi:hypothetical protein
MKHPTEDRFAAVIGIDWRTPNTTSVCAQRDLKS